jgi:hypothetical protein
VLEEGTKRAPDVWLNWQLLGNYQSDLGQYAEADTAYEHALECPNVWIASVLLNRAILANRTGDYVKALAFTSNVDDAELALRFIPVRMTALAGLGRAGDAEEVGLDALASSSDESTRLEMAEIAAEIARLRRQRGDPRSQVRAFAVSHWELNVASGSLLTVIRDIDNIYCKDAWYHRALVHGEVLQSDPSYSEAKGFYSTFDVVATTAEECLRFILALDTRKPEGYLTIQEIKSLEARPTDPLGVYWCSGRVYYKHD